MKKITKALSVLMAAVMLMTALCVPASAESIEDTAKKITSGKTYSETLYDSSSNADYKIVVTKSGTLKINFTSKMSSMDIIVYDSNGNTVSYDDISVSSGYIEWYNGSREIDTVWNSTIEKCSGTVTYKVKKGTYYVRFDRDSYSSEGSRKITFTATFPSSSSSSSSSSAKISYLSIEVPKGSKMQLAAVVSAKTSQSVSWSSSKSSVVSVTSKGKITAKAKGTAVITAKLGSSTMKIRIKVV